MIGDRKPGTPPWQREAFRDSDTDPLSGFANIMDVMLVFALGLLIALMAQSRDLQRHFKLEESVDVSQGQEIAEPPASIRRVLEGDAEGMESLGQVYRDAKTGKLILVGQ